MKSRLAKICPLLPFALAALLLSSFSFNAFAEDTPAMDLDDIKIDKYIEIPCKEFYQYLDWDNKRLIVLKDECFSTLEITEKNKIKYKKLVNFPNCDCNTDFDAFPDVNVIYGCSGWLTQLFYDLDTKKTVLFEPVFTKVHYAKGAAVLDSKRKIFLLIYGNMITEEKYDYFIYDLPNNKILSNPFEQNSDFLKDVLDYRLGDNLFLCRERDKVNTKKITNNYYIYDFSTEEKITNKLTKYLSLLGFRPGIRYLSLDGKQLIITDDFGSANRSYIVSWEDDYENITATPFFPPNFNDKKRNYIIQEVNNEWVVFSVHSVGLNGEPLTKVGFTKKNLELRIPVIVDDYFDDIPYYFFLEHPLYGSCCFVEVEKDGKKTIRMYKMSDIQAEIDKRQRGEGR